MRKLFFIISLILCIALLQAQNIDPTILKKVWRATWISVPAESPTEYGVYRFRKNISLAEKPTSYIVHISADNRYKLYINGQLVSLGPARGDLYHWNFETVDIAPYLNAGKNTIASIVWNEGKLKAVAQISSNTAFILEGNTPKEYGINTNSSWKCTIDKAYSPIEQHVYGYYAAGPGELVDMNLSNQDWLNTDFNDATWEKPNIIGVGSPKGIFNLSLTPWMLVPSSIPQMELTTQRLIKTRMAKGIIVPASFPSTKTTLTIPANSNVTLLLDQTFLTNAYPTLIYSKGKNATISLKYAEGLYDNKSEKGNRNEIDGKTLIGRCDSIVCNGLENQNYTTLFWRTYRYLQLSIHTKDEPLVVNDIYGTFTGYPFKNSTSFVSDNLLLDNILKIGWRTARLCAAETYMDCPFYEQLQYIGDTRIQAMITYYNSGDDCLARNAIDYLDYSRLAEGVTQSRYPGSGNNIIPPFSLLWIGMVSDYYHYRPDSNFVKSKLTDVRQVLSFYSNYQQNDGSLKNVPYWNFTDWAEGNPRSWKMGIPPISSNGNSSILDFQLLWAYQLAAELEQHLGVKELAGDYLQRANLLKQTIIKKYWDSTKNMFADTEDKTFYSQHANVLAILTKTVTGNDAAALYQRIIEDKDIVKASIYFKYYLNQAMVKVGFGNDYLNQLGIWQENINLGMTTWGEDSNVAGCRSDCHAWGASPNIEFFRTVLGIDSDAPGFARVKIEPHLGDLKKISGYMPHPKGKIEVSYSCNKEQKWKIIIKLPEGIVGKFVWKGKEFLVKSGENQFNL
jgi:hypothetical protein